MKLYLAAMTVALGSVGLIINTCMFRDSPSGYAPVNIAHLK